MFWNHRFDMFRFRDATLRIKCLHHRTPQKNDWKNDIPTLICHKESNGRNSRLITWKKKAKRFWPSEMLVPTLCYIDIKPPLYGQKNWIFMNFSQMAIDVGLPNIKVRKNAMWAQKNENIFSTPIFCVRPFYKYRDIRGQICFSKSQNIFHAPFINGVQRRLLLY